MSSAVAGDGAVTLARQRDDRYLWGSAVTLGLAALVVLGAVNTLSGQVVVRESGYSWPLSTVFGWRRAAAAQGWDEIVSNGILDEPKIEYRRLLLTHLVTDVFFMLVYVGVLARLATGVFSTHRGQKAVRIGVLAVLAADLVEDGLAAVLLTGRHWPLSVLPTASLCKWVFLAVTVLAILLRALMPKVGHRGLSGLAPLRRAARAAMHHRFSVALAVPLLVLTVLPGHPILEQLPDVQREWVSDPDHGLEHFVCAVIAVIVGAVLAEVFGRYRTSFARRLSKEPEPRPALRRQGPAPANWAKLLVRGLRCDVCWFFRIARALVTDRTWFREQVKERKSAEYAPLLVWLIGPAVALLGAGIVTFRGQGESVLPARLFVFCAVPLLVVVVSWVLRRLWEQICPQWRRPERPLWFSHAELSAIAFAGHAIALSILTIAGLGLLRSFTSMELIAKRAATYHWTVPALLVTGGLLAVVPWFVAWRRSDLAHVAELRLERKFDARHVKVAAADGGGTDRRARFSARSPLGLLAAIAMVVGLSLFPFGLGHHGGVAALATLAIVAAVSLPATAGLLVQERPPAEIFRLFGFRRTPLISVMVVTIVLVGFMSGRGSINTVEPGTPRNSDLRQDTRPKLANSVAAWAESTRGTGCTVVVDGHPVRPMLLVAAEGGGIRAAYWTVAALNRLVRATTPVPGSDQRDPASDRCGAHSTLLSSGASGGSVGLTVTRFSGSSTVPGPADAVAAVREMAKPATLGAAVVGTFLRDPLYGATGVPLGVDGTVPPKTWADRARLIELGWAEAHASGTKAWGDTDFLAKPDTLSPVTGQLVLNSSSAASQCRVWVSQLSFDVDRSAGTRLGEQSCNEQRGPAARTVDLFTAYGPLVPAEPANTGETTGGSLPTCLGDVSAATAALLTARFPYVTPGGVVGDCPVLGGDAATDSAPFWPRAQLVDGGYLENSGLGTVTDLAPSWSAQVRAYNADALASGEALIVPVVVYLSNKQGTASRPPARRRPQSELLVPPLTIIGGGASLGNADALLQRATTVVGTDSFCPAEPTPPARVKKGQRGELAKACTDVAAKLPRRVVVVSRTSKPEVSAPLGWTLSEASASGLMGAITRAASTRCLVPDDVSRIDPYCRRGYASLGDLISYLSPS